MQLTDVLHDQHIVVFVFDKLVSADTILVLDVLALSASGQYLYSW